MIYDDGFSMDDNLRVTKCPRCENKQFDDAAEYCRICGTPLFNMCEGQEEWDDFGNLVDRNYHKNHGNARFCEKCGRPTEFFRLKLLRPYNEVMDKYQNQYSERCPLNNNDSGELPF